MSRSLLPKLLLFLLLLPSVRAAELLSAEDQKSLIAKLQEQRRESPGLTIDFTEEKTSQLLAKPLITHGTTSFQAPNKFRRELKGDAPSLAVCNGEKLWIYSPNFKQVELYTLGQKQSFDDSLAALTAGMNFTDVDRFFRIAIAKESSGYHVTLTPKSSSLKRMVATLEVWTDEDLHLAKTEASLPKGEHVRTTYKNQRNARLSDATFEFTPPPGVQISQPLGK